MKSPKKKYFVLALPNDLGDEKEFGSFPTQKAAEKVVWEHIKEFSEYGMGMVERVRLVDDHYMLSRQWNYEMRDGQLFRRQNHGDLW